MGLTGRRLAHLLYALGVASLAAVGFLSPWWFLGFAPLGVGALWASDNLVEVTGGDTPPTPQ